MVKIVQSRGLDVTVKKHAVSPGSNKITLLDEKMMKAAEK